MRRVFKVKKLYPSGPRPLGELIYSCNLINGKHTMYSFCNKILNPRYNAEDVENYPEFYEELNPKGNEYKEAIRVLNEYQDSWFNKSSK